MIEMGSGPVSSTVPESGGVLSLVIRVFTAITGAVTSTTSSDAVPSVPVFPAASVPEAATLYVPGASADSDPSGRVQVPLPLFVAVRVCPPTMIEMVAPVSFTVPDSDGVVSFVVRGVTVIVGATVSTTSSFDVASVPAFPVVSVAVTATL